MSVLPASSKPPAFAAETHATEQTQALIDQARTLTNEVNRHVLGQGEVVAQLVLTLLAGGHAIFVGVPGLGKTLLVKTLAAAIAGSFRRIQFTPDLMPADITGSELLDATPGQAPTFRFAPGPVFANIVLADEINRTPAKTQAALLESMQEGHVTQGNKTYPLPRPFHVFATQNPIEQEGTYALPEAQLDRFMMLLEVRYPSAEDELRIAAHTGQAAPATPKPVLSITGLAALQALVPEILVPDFLLAEAVATVRASRPGNPALLPAVVRDYVAFGAGPRATQAWLRLAKARALLAGRYVVAREDLRALALPVLRHRILRNFRGEAENVAMEDIVAELLLHAFANA